MESIQVRSAKGVRLSATQVTRAGAVDDGQEKIVAVVLGGTMRR
jgi:hypothetical protein